MCDGVPCYAPWHHPAQRPHLEALGNGFAFLSQQRVAGPAHEAEGQRMEAYKSTRMKAAMRAHIRVMFMHAIAATGQGTAAIVHTRPTAAWYAITAQHASPPRPTQPPRARCLD